MNDQWTDRLSEYLDGELDAEQRLALEAHLGTCAACRGTLAELRGVVARAHALEDRPPALNLWPGIAARIAPGRRPGVNQPQRWRLSFSVPQLLAASIALVLLSGGGVWLALTGPSRPDVVTEYARDGGLPISTVGDRLTLRTDIAVAELQETLARNEGRLDTATVRVVRQNLAVIDRAIAEAQRALKADPGNAYLNLHLANTMRQKIELLRRANALAASES